MFKYFLLLTTGLYYPFNIKIIMPILFQAPLVSYLLNFISLNYFTWY